MAKSTQLNRTVINIEAEEVSFNDESTTIKGVKFNLEGEMTDVFGEIKVKALPVFLEFFKSVNKDIIEEESNKSHFCQPAPKGEEAIN